MPGTPTTGSTNIALLDSKIVASLCLGAFYVDVSPSQFIGINGAANVLGANVEISNPFGVVIKPYGPNYEITPGQDMSEIIEFAIPTQAGTFQYGKYTVKVKLFENIDDEIVSWEVVKTVSICQPDRKNKTLKYGALSAQLKASCTKGKLYVITDGLPTYNGKYVSSQVFEGELEYPTSSLIAPLEINQGVFSVQLFEGVYKVTADICATYSIGDNVYVDVPYKVKAEKHVRCLLDKCCVLERLAELNGRLSTDCTLEEKNETASITIDALRLLTMAELAGNCGEDPSGYIADLEALLGCKCTCNCLEGTPIVNNEPASDISIEGCNVGVTQAGLTTMYEINAYEYTVSIAENGGALLISNPVQEECSMRQEITFDISVVYDQIKTQAENGGNAEGLFWASIINKSIDGINPTCMGVTPEAWETMTFAQRFAALITKICACCSPCGATIINETVTQQGADVRIQWKTDATVIDVYLDGQLVATYLSAAQDPTSNVFTHIFVGASDGQPHEWTLIARCADKSQGEVATGTFQYLGCPAVAPTILTEDVVNGVVSGVSCPFDLTSLVDGSNPDTAEWHTANNNQPGSILSNPTAAAGGTFWVFNKDANGCFSPAQKITLICNSESSCTAPQNLTVGKFGVNNFFVQFQSAVYPPPSNSYTVRRRLASDPDVGGSYTTIGTPVWNASLNRWTIADLTAVDDVGYVYRAISNCGSTEPSVDYPYINIVCPVIAFIEATTSIEYSFVPIASADQILIDLFDAAGITLIKTDTYTNPFSNPVTGTFEYLTPGTQYKVRLRLRYAVVGGSEDLQTTCGSQSVETLAA